MTEKFECGGCGESKDIVPSIVVVDGYLQLKNGTEDYEGGRYCPECYPIEL